MAAKPIEPVPLMLMPAQAPLESLRCPRCQYLDVQTVGPEDVLYCRHCGWVYGC